MLLIELRPLEVILVREKNGPLLVGYIFKEPAEVVAVLIKQKISRGDVIKKVASCLTVHESQSFSGARRVDHLLQHFQFDSLELRGLLLYFRHVLEKCRNYVAPLLGALAEHLANFGLRNVLSTCS